MKAYDPKDKVKLINQSSYTRATVEPPIEWEWYEHVDELIFGAKDKKLEQQYTAWKAKEDAKKPVVQKLPTTFPMTLFGFNIAALPKSAEDWTNLNTVVLKGGGDDEVFMQIQDHLNMLAAAQRSSSGPKMMVGAPVTSSDKWSRKKNTGGMDNNNNNNNNNNNSSSSNSSSRPASEVDFWDTPIDHDSEDTLKKKKEKGKEKSAENTPEKKKESLVVTPEKAKPVVEETSAQKSLRLMKEAKDKDKAAKEKAKLEKELARKEEEAKKQAAGVEEKSTKRKSTRKGRGKNQSKGEEMDEVS